MLPIILYNMTEQLQFNISRYTSNRHVSTWSGHIHDLLFVSYNKMFKSLQWYLRMYGHAQVQNKKGADCAKQVRCIKIYATARMPSSGSVTGHMQSH